MAQHPNPQLCKSNMKRRNNIFLAIAILFVAIIGVGCNERPTNAISCDEIPAIFPDYTDVTIPCNIAPLNFRPTTEGVERCYAEVSYNGQSIEVYGKRDIRFDEKEWREILANADFFGEDISALKGDIVIGDCTKSDSVAKEPEPEPQPTEPAARFEVFQLLIPLSQVQLLILLLTNILYRQQ